MKELLAGQLDLAFLTALDLISLDSDTLRWKAVENYHMCIYLSQYHPLYHTDAAALSISQFKTDYFVAIQESTLLNCNTETEKICLNFGFRPLIKTYAENISSALLQVQFGSCVLMAPDLLTLSPSCQIRRFFIEEMLGTDYQAIVLWNTQNQAALPYVQALLQML